MAEFTDAREALEFLEAINNKDCEILSTTENGKEREPTIKDLQELNYETLINLCDLLDMSDIYQCRGDEDEIERYDDKGIVEDEKNNSR